MDSRENTAWMGEGIETEGSRGGLQWRNDFKRNVTQQDRGESGDTSPGSLAAVGSVYTHTCLPFSAPKPLDSWPPSLGNGRNLAESFSTTENHPTEKLPFHPSICPLPSRTLPRTLLATETSCQILSPQFQEPVTFQTPLSRVSPFNQAGLHSDFQLQCGCSHALLLSFLTPATHRPTASG